MSINQWTFSGILGQDAEIRQTENNQVISFSVAVDESYKDKKGEKVNKTIWVKCSKFLGKDRSTKISEVLLKGSKVVVVGKPNAITYKNEAYQECLVERIDVMFIPKSPF